MSFAAVLGIFCLHFLLCWDSSMSFAPPVTPAVVLACLQGFKLGQCHRVAVLRSFCSLFALFLKAF